LSRHKIWIRVLPAILPFSHSGIVSKVFRPILKPYIMIIRHCIGYCTLLQLPHAGRNPNLQMYQLVLDAFSCLFELLLLHMHISKYTPQARIYAHHDSLKALGAKLQTQMRVAYCKAIPVFPRLVRKEPWKQYPLLCSSFYHSLSLLMHIPGNSPPSLFNAETFPFPSRVPVNPPILFCSFTLDLYHCKRRPNFARIRTYLSLG